MWKKVRNILNMILQNLNKTNNDIINEIKVSLDEFGVLFFRNQKTSPFLTAILSSFRSEIPKVIEDRVLHNDIEKAIKFIQTLELENELLFD